jgi:hypothetical protein
VTGRAVVSGTATVVRGLNELRLAVLGILVGIALSVAFGVDGLGGPNSSRGWAASRLPASSSGGRRHGIV